MIGPNGHAPRLSHIPRAAVEEPTLVELRLAETRLQEGLREVLPHGRPLGTTSWVAKDLDPALLAKLPENRIAHSVAAVTDSLHWDLVRHLHGQGMRIEDGTCNFGTSLEKLNGRDVVRLTLSWTHKDFGARGDPWPLPPEEPKVEAGAG